MKRMWIGVVLLAVLLISGILVTEFMERTHGPIAEDLAEAAALAMEGHWDKAEALTVKVRKSWEKRLPLTAAFVDHEPMEEVEALFARIDVCARERNRLDFASTCAYLAKLMEALGESHSLNFRNLM